MSNKTSDKNVGSIEDDVKRCNELIKVEHANWIGISNQLAISHILAEREQLIVEKKKYTIRLTDEQYRKVIENAQMDTSNDTVVAHRFAVMQQQINEKDKQIQELETKLEFKEYGDLDNLQFEEYMNQFVPKQVVIDKIKKLKKRKDKYEYETQEIFLNAYYDRKRLEIIHKIDILQELLEGEI